MLLKILAKIFVFILGGLGLVMSAWGTASFAYYIAAKRSYPIGDILTPIGFFLIITIAIPFIIFGSRICFFSWKLIFVPSKKLFIFKVSIKRFFLEIAYLIGAIITIPCLWTVFVILISFNFNNSNIANLAMASLFSLPGITIIIVAYKQMTKINQKIE